MAASLTITGASNVKANLRRMRARFPDKARQGLLTFAETKVLPLVKSRIPRRHGTLRNTVHATPPERVGDHIKLTIAAGGPSTPNAAALHEHPDNTQFSPPTWRGPLNYTTAGTGNKYIEKPVIETSGDLAPAIAQAVDVSRL